MSNETIDNTNPEAVAEGKPENTDAKIKEEDTVISALGKEACKRHGLPAVWVTADGMCFKQENDARYHSKSLGLPAEPLKVEA